jgi:Zn-dependent protease with chaperone function
MTTALAAVEPAGDGVRREEILGGFRGAIRPVRVPPLYLGALAVVALAMVLLPLVYLGLIGGALYGVFWYAVHGWQLLGGSGSIKARLFGFITPLVTGAILVLFMIKPLFARPARPQEPKKLRPDEEPLLFAFVQRVCRTVGAPQPHEIRIDGEVNASASFRRGVLSLFSGDLVLTLGLPLVAGLSLPQLAGVLAHEFGHFTQRAALRLSFVVRSVNVWFARVVYERDAWDEQLLSAAKKSDYRIRIVLWIAIAFVWLTRKILWALMIAGHVLSSFLMRQMELDADRYQARLVGHEVARSTFDELFGLSLAHRQAWMILPSLWQEGRLGDRFTGLVAAGHRQLLTRAPQIYQDYVAQTKTGLFDTHPSDRERIARLEREGEAGIFTCDLPATALFADFESIEKAFTADLYREVLGERFDEAALVSVDESVAAQRRALTDAETVQRYLERDPDSLWPFPLLSPRPALPGDPAAALREARDAVAARREAYAAEVRSHEAISERLRKAVAADTALRAGFQIKPEDFGLSENGFEAATQAIAQARADLAATEARLQALEELSARRLLTALALHSSPGVEEPRRQLDCLAFCNGIHPRLVELLERNFRLGLLDRWNGPESGMAAAARLREEMERISKMLQDLAGPLAGQPYPFDDRRDGLTLAALAKLDVPLGREVEDVHRAVDCVLQNLLSLYTRLQASLARTAETVEEALGLDHRQSEEMP